MVEPSVLLFSLIELDGFYVVFHCVHCVFVVMNLNLSLSLSWLWVFSFFQVSSSDVSYVCTVYTM